MEKMTGTDLKTALADTKESVSGIDQWKPAEFKMLSDRALEQLTDVINLIADGAEWPCR